METFVFLFLEHRFVPVGKLRFEDQGRYSSSIFAYGRNYLKRSYAVAIDPLGLPLREGRFQTAVDFPIFSALRDAAPDQWGRYLLGKEFGRTLNELEYILAAGAGRIGALAFGPDLDGPAILGPSGYQPYNSVDLDIALCAKGTQDAVTNATSEELKRLLRYGPSVGGARPKAPVMWLGRPHIAKFSTTLDTRNEPLIEYATMRLAKLAGLDVPEIHLEKVLGRDVYLVERFDRVSESGKPEQKIHFLSGLTMMQLHEADCDHWSYPLLCQAIIKFSDRVAADLRELFRRMVFNILVNNDDDHPRNHGFIHVGENSWRLSKVYDLVPRDQQTQTFRLALNIGVQGKVASRKNAISAHRAFRLEEAEAESLWSEVADVVVESWERVFLESGLKEDEIARFRNSIGIEYKM